MRKKENVKNINIEDLEKTTFEPLEIKQGEEDLKWYEEAVSLSDADELFQLGVIREESGDLVDAKRWSEEVAELDNFHILNDLGETYYSSGIIQYDQNNLLEAKKILLIAISYMKVDNSKAKFALGMVHEKSGDLVEAKRWYEEAASLSHSNAMYNLGALYKRLGNVVEAKEWFKKAASFDDSRAMVYLGIINKELGELVEAKEWYEKSASLNHSGAMYILGKIYKESDDLVVAKKRYEKAAELGHLDAIYNLGVIHQELGDLVEAKKWYEKASINGDAQAKYQLDLINNQEHENDQDSSDSSFSKNEDSYHDNTGISFAGDHKVYDEL